MDYCNKKISFLHSKKSVKITTKLPITSSNPTCQIYLCSDLAAPNKTYCLKIITTRSDDKNHNSSIYIEIVLLLSLASVPNIIHIIDYYSMTSQNNNVYFTGCGAAVSADRSPHSHPRIHPNDRPQSARRAALRRYG